MMETHLDNPCSSFEAWCDQQRIHPERSDAWDRYVHVMTAAFASPDQPSV